ncbi:MAG: hypothetical protein ACTMII_13035 [Brachybacterium sp.]
MGHPYPGQRPSPQQRSRTGFWCALACVLTLLAIVFLAVTGGVVYLVSRDRGSPPGPTETASGPELVSFEHEFFSFAYPATWFDLNKSADPADAVGVAELADEDIAPDDLYSFATNSITVYMFDSDLHAVMTCRTQATWTGFGWDEPGDPEELDPITLDGKELAAHRTTGTHDGQDAVGEMYCADVADDVVQIVVETHGATELSPEIRQILDSWVWTEG